MKSFKVTTVFETFSQWKVRGATASDGDHDDGLVNQSTAIGYLL